MLEAEIHGLSGTRPTSDWMDFRMYFAQSLRVALSDSMRWNIFYSIMYRGETLTELSQTLGVSEAYISVNLTNPIMETLRSMLREYYGGRSSKRIRITEMRTSLLEFLPDKEFRAFVPQPRTLAEVRQREPRALVL